MLLQISSLEMEETPKIDEAIESLSEMSKIFDQLISLTDCLDRLVESESTLTNVKQNVKRFVSDFENRVKTFTENEKILTSYLKGSIDFSKINISEDSKIEQKKFEKGESSQTISLRPQTSRTKPIFENIEMSPEKELIKLHSDMMERLFGLSDTKNMIVDKSGIYPRIYFLQGADPEEIRDWYDFGSIATIYLTTPDFPEIYNLPGWIKEGVKDNFENNSLISINNTLALDFFSASPDFENNQRFPVWHFIRMRKVIQERNMISNIKKIFKPFNEENIHYRRGLGLIVIKRQMESALKRPFRSYGKPDRLGSIMISVDCRATPDSAKRFLLKKINMIEAGEIHSSQYALDYVENRLADEAYPQRFRRQERTRIAKEEKD